MQFPISLGPFHVRAGEGPVDLLLACHDRIRGFGDLAARLAASPPAPEDRVADAALLVLRYFTLAFPHHHADEEESVVPRLRKVEDASLEAALDALGAQHAAILEALPRLVSRWRVIAEDPAALVDLAPDLRDLTARLRDLLDVHLELEERVVFPAIQERLGPADRDRIVQEMRARRG